jgi:hypothetical protein
MPGRYDMSPTWDQGGRTIDHELDFILAGIVERGIDPFERGLRSLQNPPKGQKIQRDGLRSLRDMLNNYSEDVEGHIQDGDIIVRIDRALTPFSGSFYLSVLDDLMVRSKFTEGSQVWDCYGSVSEEDFQDYFMSFLERRYSTTGDDVSSVAHSESSGSTGMAAPTVHVMTEATLRARSSGALFDLEDGMIIFLTHWNDQDLEMSDAALEGSSDTDDNDDVAHMTAGTSWLCLD